MSRLATFLSALAMGLVVLSSAPDLTKGMRFSVATASAAEEDWKQEFERLCAKTQDAMLLTADELKDLVTQCDRLKAVIEKLDETQSKIYLKRLKMCRDLYAYVLESKEKKGAE